METFKQYYKALTSSGVTRTSDIPYGNKQADHTITFVLPIIDTTEGFYKMIVPAMALNKYHPTIRCLIIGMELYDPDKSINYYSPELKQRLIKETDFLVFPFVAYPLESIIEQVKIFNPKIKIGYHVDFNFYLVPDSYPFSNLYNNSEAHTIIEKNMRIVDRVFVTNRNLVDTIYEKVEEKYKKGYLNNIVYQPLMFNKSYFKAIIESEDRDKPEKYRIGIIASSTHLPDLNYIKGVLTEILNKHSKKAEIVIFGFDGEHKGRNYLKGIDFTYVPRVSIFEYYQKIKDLSLDIALIPAKDNAFNRTSKNYIKYMELTYLGVPVIMPQMTPYRDVVEHNKSGLICKDKENWLWELEQGIKGSEKIEQLAQASYVNVLNYDILIPNNLKLIETLYSFRKPE